MFKLARVLRSLRKKPKIRFKVQNPIDIKKHYYHIKHAKISLKLRKLEREYIEIYDLLKEEWLNGISPMQSINEPEYREPYLIEALDMRVCAWLDKSDNRPKRTPPKLPKKEMPGHIPPSAPMRNVLSYPGRMDYR